MKKILIFAAILLCIIYLAFAVKKTLAKQAFERGMRCAEKGDNRGAIREFSTSYSLMPDNPGTLTNRASAYEALGMSKEALGDYDDAVKLALKLTRNSHDPRLAEIYFNRGVTYDHHKAYARAVADYDRAIKMAPDTADVYNNLAWLLATCPDKSVRDGKRAVALAQKECERSKWHDAIPLDTLAAAYAESGAFSEAERWEQTAILHCVDSKVKAECQQRARLYAQKKAYRQP